jgi:hypothetical protein
MFSAFLADIPGQICAVLLLVFFMKIPNLWSIFSTIQRKRCFILEHSTDKRMTPRQAITDGTVWRVVGGKKGDIDTEIFEADPKDVVFFLNTPAIDVYKSYTAGIPAEVPAFIKWVKENLGIDSFQELDDVSAVCDDIHADIQDEIKDRLELPENEERIYAEREALINEEKAAKRIVREKQKMEKRLKKKVDFDQTPTYKKLYNKKNTPTYKALKNYKTTPTYKNLSALDQDMYDRFAPVKYSGLIPLPYQPIVFSDVMNFLKYNHDPGKFAVDRKNAIADTKLELADMMHSKGGGGGGLLGGMDKKTIIYAIGAVILVIVLSGAMPHSAPAVAPIATTAAQVAVTAASNGTVYAPP